MENNIIEPVPSAKGGKGWVTWVVVVIVVLVAALIFVFTRSEVATESPAEDNAASVEAALSGLGELGGVYVEANDGSYAGVCRSPGFISAITSAARMIVDEDFVCYDNAEAFVVGASFIDAGTAQTFCINSAGKRGILPGMASAVVVSTGFQCGQ